MVEAALSQGTAPLAFYVEGLSEDGLTLFTHGGIAVVLANPSLADRRDGAQSVKVG